MDNSNYKLDLHTHSIISYDGGIALAQYRQILTDQFRILAITDHNEISLARQLHQEFPEQVIVGEEILTRDGEIIGLYLKQLISPGQSATETIQQIKAQGGLVYIPHPFEIRRHGLWLKALERIADSIDILEVFNARNIEPGAVKKSEQFGTVHKIIGAASSDAHSVSGLGSAYTLLNDKPNRENLVNLVGSAQLVRNRAAVWAFFAPAINKLKKKLRS